MVSDGDWKAFSGEGDELRNMEGERKGGLSHRALRTGTSYSVYGHICMQPSHVSALK